MRHAKPRRETSDPPTSVCVCVAKKARKGPQPIALDNIESNDELHTRIYTYIFFYLNFFELCLRETHNLYDTNVRRAKMSIYIIYFCLLYTQPLYYI